MEDATETGRPNPMRQREVAGEENAMILPGMQLLQALAGESAGKGEERGVTTMDGLFAWEKAHLSLKLVVRHECTSIK